MKSYFALIFLVYSNLLFGQKSQNGDSLTVIKLGYEILDSSLLSSKRNVFKDSPIYHFPNVVTYIDDDEDSEKGYTNKLAFRVKDKNNWTSFDLPFSFPKVQLSNLDTKGRPELIIYGIEENLGAHSYGVIECLLIVNIDSIPTQLLFIKYSSREELFDPAGGNEPKNITEGRKIEIVDKKIIIGTLDKSSESIELTKIPSGIYLMEKGRIRKKK